MWLSASPPGDPGFNAPRQTGRAVATLVVIAVALLIGVGLGGASVFAIVAALTGAPTQGVGGAGNKAAENKTAESKTAESKTAENPQPAGRVAAAAASPDPSAGVAAAVSAPTMPASTPEENLADQPPARPTAAPTEQALVTPPLQPVKPWPDALTRAHRAEESETPARDQAAAAPSAAPRAPASERGSGDRSHSESGAANGEHAAGKTADRATSESTFRRQPPPKNFDEADRRASLSRNGRRAGIEPHERFEPRERVRSRERDDADGEGDRWRNHDAWRGGLFGLFSRGGNWRDRSDNWEDDRDD